ncbi:pentapeptide repeat-containing protein [Treponema parvum]|uniref:Pentapeptide repeat-containing protein n=1 Tax=Treponema parvum TaxID=138851 RepID=A0A975IEZ8_9SPIR|nr:pentapeptide repeat-containing protein [Treponema parvum]QTQ14413.1 pentapeptide repeat-containing protein [Treponema parvum]
MFQQTPCHVSSCLKAELSSFDDSGNIIGTGGYCLDHIPDPEKAKQDILAYISAHEKIIGLNASGITFCDLDFSGKKFYGCNFQHCTFSNIKAEEMRSRMSVFDFSIFTDCNLLKSNIQFCSFGGCTFSHTLLTGSDLVQDNFCGLKAFQSSFDDTDLYNSRFIKADLIDTSFRNCNIKKTVFWEIKQENASFKLSNTREAEFDRSGSELFSTAGLS